jgi:hypothetical protein
MKKAIIVLCVILTTASASFAQAAKDTTKTKKSKMETAHYTCTMHPEVVSDKPGKCPKCGMTLVMMKKGNKDSMMGGKKMKM